MYFRGFCSAGASQSMSSSAASAAVLPLSTFRRLAASPSSPVTTTAPVFMKSFSMPKSTTSDRISKFSSRRSVGDRE